jgi:hypothetical protein
MEKGMKKRVFWTAFSALAFGLTVPVSAADFSKHEGNGTCGEGMRLAQVWEVKKDIDSACGALAEWDIARLSDGGALGGSGYKCEVVDKKDDTLGHSLCIKAPELSQAVGTFAWSVNGNPGGDTTLNADGTCANTSNSIDCVWILSDAQQRQFTLNWNNGMYVDTMVLSEDASMIEGENQHNHAIKGVRK